MNKELFFRKTQPWEEDSYEVIRSSSKYRNTTFKSVYSTIVNSNKIYWKLGDLIKFDSGYHDYFLRNNWRYWYYNEEDRYNYIKNNCGRNIKVPLYAANETAIIIGRYKWTKYKYSTFSDYGSVVMMLTGTSIGKVRRYYACTPWEKIDTYPYHTNEYPELFQGVNPLSDVNTFLQKLTETIGAL